MLKNLGQLSLLDNNRPAHAKPRRLRIGGEIVQTSPVFETYWRFAADRQEIFFKRLRKEWPVSTNSIFNRFRFTNAYRASDRVSQYLISEVIYQGEQSAAEVFFRTLVFKLFNKIETWQLLISKLGEVSFRNFSLQHYDRVLTDALAAKRTIYSAAYIMPSGGRNSEGRKHLTHLRLLQEMMKDNVPLKIAECQTMQQAFLLLRSYPLIGDFLGFQFVTDLNYSRITNFNEMDFVVPGPGARDGLRKCFPGLNLAKAGDTIRYMAENQQLHFQELTISFRNLWGRPLQLIDCQNLFCEVDKYSRQAHPEIKGESTRTRIKQRFFPNPEPIRLFYPPKWNINEKIPKEFR